MPVNSNLTKSDPLIMTPIEVNDHIVAKLQTKGFFIIKGNSNSEVDVRAVKDDFELIIESRGNQAHRNKDTDLVFDSSQLDTHLSDHLTQIMRFQQSVSTNKNAIYIMGNPDIPRIKERVAKIKVGLDKLKIVRFWVNEFEEIVIDGPTEIEETLNNLL